MSETTHALHRRAILMLLLTTVLWGISFPVIKSLLLLNRALLPGAGSWMVTACALAPRFAVATLLMGIFGGRSLIHPTRSEIKQGLGLGLFTFGGTLLQSDGMQFTSASTSAFLSQLYVILIPLWFALRRRRFPEPIVWVGCLFVLGGVAILGHFDWQTLRFGRGETETLFSTVFFTALILWIDKREFAGNRPGTATWIMFAVQAILYLGFAWLSASGAGSLAAPLTSLPWIGLTLVLGVVCTIGAFLIMNVWQPHVPATQAALIYCLEPVLASIFALVLPGFFSHWASIDYPNERATVSLVTGGGLIIAANILVQLAVKPPAVSADLAGDNG